MVVDRICFRGRFSLVTGTVPIPASTGAYAFV